MSAPSWKSCPIQSFTCLFYVLLTHRENPIASASNTLVSGKSGNQSVCSEMCSETLLEAVGNPSWAKIHCVGLFVVNGNFED